MIRHILPVGLLLAAGTSVLAQTQRFALPPGPVAVDVARDVEYRKADAVVLRMDVYRPASRGRARYPVLIFFSRGQGAARSQLHLTGWARAAASRGVAAVVPDLRAGSEAKDFEALLAHVREHAATFGIDPEAIAVYAASGNVFTAFPLLEDPKQTTVKAAVMYYGAAPISEFRRDLPVLVVRAGLDRPVLNQGITSLASLAVSQNAPLTLLNHPTGYHAFETLNDDDATRDVIAQTIEFVKRTTARSYQVAIRQSIVEATAAGDMVSRKYREAASTYAELAAARPDDARVGLAYGEALLADAQYAAACAQFDKLRDKGLGARDLGLPAARACMQKGDPDAAIAWLRSIPTRFLPPNVRDEPVFAPLKERADFQALFAAPR